MLKGIRKIVSKHYGCKPIIKPNNIKSCHIFRYRYSTSHVEYIGRHSSQNRVLAIQTIS